MRMIRISLLCIYLFVIGCNTQNIDWQRLYDLAKEEHENYLRTFSDDDYHNALNLYDHIAKGSSEFRNRALYSKATMMIHAREYDSAVKVVKQIQDTSNVFSTFLTKSILINTIMVYKSQENNDDGEIRLYSKYIVDELEPQITAMSDSIYYAISNPLANDSFDPNYTIVSNQALSPFVLYLYYLKLYDISKYKEEISMWKNGLIESNDNSEMFFLAMDNMF